MQIEAEENSHGKLIHLPSTADYFSLRLLELIPGREERSDMPPTGQQPITLQQRALISGQSSITGCGRIFRCTVLVFRMELETFRKHTPAFPTGPVRGDLFRGSSDPVESGATAVTNLEPD